MYDFKFGTYLQFYPNIHALFSCVMQLGFITQQFPLDGDWFGAKEDTIGILQSGTIMIDKNYIDFIVTDDRYFKKLEVIGVGIVHNSTTMECFATLNGRLLGKIIYKLFK